MDFIFTTVNPLVEALYIMVLFEIILIGIVNYYMKSHAQSFTAGIVSFMSCCLSLMQYSVLVKYFTLPLKVYVNFVSITKEAVLYLLFCYKLASLTSRKQQSRKNCTL